MIIRMIFKKLSKAVKSMQNTLTVIETVNRQYYTPLAKFLSEKIRFLFNLRAFGRMVILFVIVLHWGGIYMYYTVVKVMLIQFAVDVTYSVYCNYNVTDVVMCMTSYEI